MNFIMNSLRDIIVDLLMQQKFYKLSIISLLSSKMLRRLPLNVINVVVIWGIEDKLPWL